jgi:hypothetical protein
MIVGNGSLAKLLKDREGAILFASGVGDSLCADSDEFYREEHLLIRIALNNETQKCLFYFSSIVNDLYLSPYYIHKRRMELVVKNTCENYNIIRVGNIWECTNPNTFRNAIKAKQAKGEPVEIRDEFKYMIHADQLNMVVQGLPLTGKNEISVFGEMLKVKDCL